MMKIERRTKIAEAQQRSSAEPGGQRRVRLPKGSGEGSRGGVGGWGGMRGTPLRAWGSAGRAEGGRDPICALTPGTGRLLRRNGGN